MLLDHHFYLAPLQGFTDFVYRRCHHQLIGSIDEFYIPYLAIGPGKKIRNSQLRDCLPENNIDMPVVPQILCANADELKLLASELQQMGYSKVNLNLGCPYPMATKRGRGTALLENTTALKAVLDNLFSDFNFQVSVKFRSGMTDEQTILNQFELLQNYPFEKLIFHPRTAKQLYKGQANRKLFAQLVALSDKPLVYNGDISSKADIDEILQLVPSQRTWMIGRGILSDPLLINQLKGETISEQEALQLKMQFHQQVLDAYRAWLQDDGHVLMKMKQFWSYFANSFPNPAKTYKPIKKASKLDRFLEVYPSIFQKSV
ncbi:tRNA-dihydrouridine synthase family protein [uncultured Sunxiuqinia sp.]|uniref:tRNA-dihydrouridine synthase family protein n=1 Tax=uncultured Sunxiuqinia sp. TaxID=1573825 RepID=UPI00262D2AD8|nr:tRNA-dihydrouridine synthase family protein [uncultured Sunxiuqinia sp.]